MAGTERARANTVTGEHDDFSVNAPQIGLPKGGGAIRGIGEKFSTNPVTGTGSMSVPIATSAGRGGFGPQLTLSYDSGAGNGPFGFGWSLLLPAITRKTDRGLPRYAESDKGDSDVFILAGAEDLVPAPMPDGAPSRQLAGYTIHRYRPRVEGLFARIERWTQDATGDVHWRSTTRDNILTIYGKDATSRIADPGDAARIFSWLISETRDDKGNAALYVYKPEDGANVDLAQACERNRGERDSVRRKANRYLERIRYGNRTTLLDAADRRPRFLADDVIANTKWMFEAVFDYGEHDKDVPLPDEPGKEWLSRADAFSSYRATFEVRTNRLCRRVLMFHHFPEDPEVGLNCLVQSTDFTYLTDGPAPDLRNAPYSFLKTVTQFGYKRSAGGYLSRSLPPLEFTYAERKIDETVREVDPHSAAHPSNGLPGARYQWVDLDGEGAAGVLTEHGRAWYYKRNLSPLDAGDADEDIALAARFAPMELVASVPSAAAALGRGSQQLLDLSGDGQLALVDFQSASPGFFERTSDQDWAPLHSFASLPALDWSNPRLRFIDLTGDGHADIFIVGDEVFCWHASLAKDGFGPEQRVSKALDEEQGPRLVFADATESMFLADLSGDGLTDLVRIRNGEVCYWPNLGYGRFGARVSMDHAPWFDAPDLFDGNRIRLADIDGSGSTDIVYLAASGVRLYFNQSGNGWGQRYELNVFPAVDSAASVAVLDLLGNGTACLTWSSPLLTDARAPMRYVDLMGSHKPHLLVKVANNLGAETRVDYLPSTHFYLRDRLAGQPWVTRLPFPVQCVAKVTVTDKWRKTSFATAYSYHHGYFDGIEREFRGFGRVERVDSESYGEFASGNASSPYITDDKTLYQPPVKTVTWFHTGAEVEGKGILSQFAHEYFPRWFEDRSPETTHVLGDFAENVLPEPDLDPAELSAEEWREALRACKGMMLRSEVYELDVDALARGEHVPVKLFSTACQNCHIQRLQPIGNNLHAVFLVGQSESMTYEYELDLRPQTLAPDPRVAHKLNLKFDEQANVLQSVTIAYPRRGQFVDPTLTADTVALINRTQQEIHLAYAEIRYTQDFDAADPDDYRSRVPFDVLTYELTGLSPEDADDRLSPDALDNHYFSIDELRRFRLSGVHQSSGDAVEDIAYQKIPSRNSAQKRLVGRVRTLYFDDTAAVLSSAFPLGKMGRLALAFENYKLALTDDLLDIVFTNAAGNRVEQPVKGATTARQLLRDAAESGYLSGADLVVRFARTPPDPAEQLAGQYWIRSGIAGFEPDAGQHFYLAERYTDPFGNVTTQEYDPIDLFVARTIDPLGNTTEVTRFDYRVMTTRELKDGNGNLTEIYFDAMGRAAATALKGKGAEGDRLTELNDALCNPEASDLAQFFGEPDLDLSLARAWLGNATARQVYYFGQVINPDGSTSWNTRPSCSCGILREQHASALAPGSESPLRATFEYSDGMGSVIAKKVQAEPETPGKPMRWVASGKTVLNNKGQPVKQYDPFFSPPEVGHQFEDPPEVGLTPVVYYDAAGRTVRTEMADGSLSRVEFSPWHARGFDQNDTVAEPGNAWFLGMTLATASAQQKRAAQLAGEHADTPTLTLLDSLGRNVISIVHNRVKDSAGVLRDERYLTFTKFDPESRPLWVRDARNHLVIQYITPPVPSDQAADPVDGFAPCYGMAGDMLLQHSMDAADLWLLNDAAGKIMLAWNSRGHVFRTDYDELRRPLRSIVKGADGADPNREVCVERMIYGEQHPEDVQRNLRGRLFMQLDQAGALANERHDFEGNLLRASRRLATEFKKVVSWQAAEPALPTDHRAKFTLAALDAALAPLLENETFTSGTTFDALSRPIQLFAAHSSRPGTRFDVIQPAYNEASLLHRLDVWEGNAAEPATVLNPATASLHAVTNIDYDAKGQRTRIEYGNGVATAYDYDPKTLRLIRLLTRRNAAAFPDDAASPPPAGFSGSALQNLSYIYDPVGNITSIRDDAQQTIYFLNRRVEPSNDYTYDATYRLVKATGREHLGLTAGTPNAPTSADALNAFHTGQHHRGDGTAMGTYVERYSYDAVGNILFVRHQGSDPAHPGWKRCYQYANDSNRLLSTSNPSIAHNPDNACPTNYAAAPVYVDKYSYDAHGNITTMSHLPRLEWDFKDHLHATSRQVVDSGTPEMTFCVYDAAGQRSRKVTERANGTRRQERIYLGGFEVYREYDASGANVMLERETLHVMDDKRRIALVETRTMDSGNPVAAPVPVRRFQLGNHLGSSSIELDEAAQLISYEEYFPFGSTSYQAMKGAAEVSLKRYRYTGCERDEETGFAYHGARYLAPWLGRWASPDPLGIGDGPNVYRYVSNNPLTSKDVTGTQEAPAHAGGASPGKPDIRNLDDALNHLAKTPQDCRVTNTDLDKFNVPPPDPPDPLEQLAKLHGEVEGELYKLRRELGELQESYEAGSATHLSLEHMVPSLVVAGIRDREDKIRALEAAGLTELSGTDNKYHSTVLEGAIENGIIQTQEDQERFLRIAESARVNTVAPWAIWRGVELLLAFLPGEGAGGALFAKAPPSSAAALAALNKAASAAKIEGKFTNVIEFMSKRAMAFQKLVSGGIEAGTSFLRNGVKFDSVDTARGVLVDAKGPGYASFVEKGGSFYGWFRGRDALVDQARRQFRAAGGMPIEWVFAEEKARLAAQALLRRELTARQFATFTFKLK